MVSRHSVKNPYPHPGAPLEPGVISLPIAAFTGRDLPDFSPAQPGELTAHGWKLMELLGAYQREHYADFFARQPCQGLAIYADPASQRDVDSARAFAGSLFGTCQHKVNEHASHARLARVFRDTPDASDLASGCGVPSPQQLVALLGGHEFGDAAVADVHNAAAAALAPWLRVYRRQLGLVQDHLQCCSHEACDPEEATVGGLCTLFSLPLSIAPNVTWRAVGGPLGVASAFAEIFEMQLCNGLDAGWGLREEDVVELLSLLDLPFNRLGANDVSARNLGSDLLEEVLVALTRDDAEERAVSVYFGHDTNLQFLRRLLKLSWLSDGWWPNVAEPGSQLVFEVYENGEVDGEPGSTVRVLKVAARPHQQRTASPLTSVNPPSVLPLWVPGCDDVYCPLAQFVSIAQAAMRTECIGGHAEVQAVKNLKKEVGNLKKELEKELLAEERLHARDPEIVAAVDSLGSAADLKTRLEKPLDYASLPGFVDPAASTPSPQLETQHQDPSSSHSSVLTFLVVAVLAFLLWRQRHKQNAARGYETIGGSSGSSRIGHSNTPGFEML